MKTVEEQIQTLEASQEKALAATEKYSDLMKA
jgi:hypothetical protein